LHAKLITAAPAALLTQQNERLMFLLVLITKKNPASLVNPFIFYMWKVKPEK
jgi:hypothetical protein